MTALIVNVTPLAELTDEAFHQLCQANRDLRFERTAQGALIVMPPTSEETGNRNFKLYEPFLAWDSQEQLGFCFDSSTTFKPPNRAIRSSDLAWVQRSGWQALMSQARTTFPPICSDFLVELRCETDALRSLQDKMQEYLSNGVRLGWLINPQNRCIEIYRPGQAVEVLEAPITLSGEDVLPTLLVDISQILPS